MNVIYPFKTIMEERFHNLGKAIWKISLSLKYSFTLPTKDFVDLQTPMVISLYIQAKLNSRMSSPTNHPSSIKNISSVKKNTSIYINIITNMDILYVYQQQDTYYAFTILNPWRGTVDRARDIAYLNSDKWMWIFEHCSMNSVPLYSVYTVVRSQ